MTQEISSDDFPDIIAFQNVFEYVHFELGQGVLILIAIVGLDKNRVLMNKLSVLEVVRYKENVLEASSIQEDVLVPTDCSHLLVYDTVLFCQDDVEKLPLMLVVVVVCLQCFSTI